MAPEAPRDAGGPEAVAAMLDTLRREMAALEAPGEAAAAAAPTAAAAEAAVVDDEDDGADPIARAYEAAHMRLPHVWGAKGTRGGRTPLKKGSIPARGVVPPDEVFAERLRLLVGREASRRYEALKAEDALWLLLTAGFLADNTRFATRHGCGHTRANIEKTERDARVREEFAAISTLNRLGAALLAGPLCSRGYAPDTTSGGWESMGCPASSAGGVGSGVTRTPVADEGVASTIPMAPTPPDAARGPQGGAAGHQRSPAAHAAVETLQDLEASTPATGVPSVPPTLSPKPPPPRTPGGAAATPSVQHYDRRRGHGDAAGGGGDAVHRALAYPSTPGGGAPQATRNSPPPAWTALSNDDREFFSALVRAEVEATSPRRRGDGDPPRSPPARVGSVGSVTTADLEFLAARERKRCHGAEDVARGVLRRTEAVERGQFVEEFRVVSALYLSGGGGSRAHAPSDPMGVGDARRLSLWVNRLVAAFRANCAAQGERSGGETDTTAALLRQKLLLYERRDISRGEDCGRVAVVHDERRQRAMLRERMALRRPLPPPGHGAPTDVPFTRPSLYAFTEDVDVLLAVHLELRNAQR